MENLNKKKAVFAFQGTDAETVRRLRLFRKRLFVDELGWDLKLVGEEERDEFDTDDALHCALFEGHKVVGGFRLTPTDRPYLSRDIFPQLATVRPFPVRADMAEISRLGVVGEGTERFRRALAVYGLMMEVARAGRFVSLVAVADLTYERFLRRIGIATHRYGPPGCVGTDRFGRTLHAVAGEIPLGEQPAQTLARLRASLQDVEIHDVASVFGPQRLSA